MIQADDKLHFTPKENNDSVQFLIRSGTKDRLFTNLFTGEVAIPHIGKYSRNQYHFLNVDCMVEIALDKIDDKWWSKQEGKIQKQIISLPDSVNDILNTIPEQIVHNKPPPKDKQQKKQSKKQKKQGKQKKLDEYLIKDQQIEIEEGLQQMEQEQIKQYEKIEQIDNIQQQQIQQDDIQQKQQKQDEQDEKIPEFHPLQFKKPKQIKFTWTISSLKTNKILQPLKQENCLSYVNHNWIFEEINFEFQKKLINLIPICLLEPKNVYEYNDPFKAINFGQLRSEYLSVHLGQQGSLCFSPNNMKVSVDLKADLISFWIIILSEDNVHNVFYHWIILSDLISQMSQQITKECKIIEQLLSAYKDISPSYGEQVNVLKKLFNID